MLNGSTRRPSAHRAPSAPASSLGWPLGAAASEAAVPHRLSPLRQADGLAILGPKHPPTGGYGHCALPHFCCIAKLFLTQAPKADSFTILHCSILQGRSLNPGSGVDGRSLEEQVLDVSGRRLRGSYHRGHSDQLIPGTQIGKGADPPGIRRPSAVWAGSPRDAPVTITGLDLSHRGPCQGPFTLSSRQTASGSVHAPVT